MMIPKWTSAAATNVATSRSKKKGLDLRLHIRKRNQFFWRRPSGRDHAHEVVKWHRSGPDTSVEQRSVFRPGLRRASLRQMHDQVFDRDYSREAAGLVHVIL